MPDSSRAGWRALALAALFLLLPLAACDRTEPTEPPPEGTPRLVVLVVADQFRYDYLERARPLFTGGLKRLLDEGVSFRQAHHGHAATLTAPGYATLATGAHPARSGVVANDWRDRPRPDEVYCVGDDRFGTSPENLEVDALADWIKARYPESKVFSVGGKDRSAVLLGGHAADGVFWFDDEAGGMTTSGYYMRQPPEWLRGVNEEGPPGGLFLGAWEALPVDAEAAAAAGFGPFDRGPFERGFPHLVGGTALEPDSERFLDGVYDTPFLDTWVTRVGLGVVERENLGIDEWPDLLALSLASLDTVGHYYGPNSLEVLDTLLRLDRDLGELFDHLDEQVGRERYVVALSADHGVVPVPEVIQRPERRAGLEEVRCRRRVVADFRDRYGDDVWLGEPFYLDHAVLEGAGSGPAAAQAELAELLGRCPHVRRVWTLGELLEADFGGPETIPAPGTEAWYRMLHRNSTYEERSPDVMIQWEEGFLTSLGHWTTHGSAYGYDTHVPFLLAGGALQPGVVDDLILTVDLAPTLAAALGVQPTEPIDGVDRLDLARNARPARAVGEEEGGEEVGGDEVDGDEDSASEADAEFTDADSEEGGGEAPQADPDAASTEARPSAPSRPEPPQPDRRSPRAADEAGSDASSEDENEDADADVDGGAEEADGTETGADDSAADESTADDPGDPVLDLPIPEPPPDDDGSGADAVDDSDG